MAQSNRKRILARNVCSKFNKRFFSLRSFEFPCLRNKNENEKTHHDCYINFLCVKIVNSIFWNCKKPTLAKLLAKFTFTTVLEIVQLMFSVVAIAKLLFTGCCQRWLILNSIHWIRIHNVHRIAVENISILTRKNQKIYIFELRFGRV